MHAFNPNALVHTHEAATPDADTLKTRCVRPVAEPVPTSAPLAAPVSPPAQALDFAERHDDPAQAEELERQQDA